MSDITVNTSGYWGNDSILASGSFSGLVHGDTVTIENGAICTIDADQQTPTGIGVGLNIVCTSGFSKLKIKNASTSTPIIFYGEDGGTLQFETSCEFETDGDCIEIYTGTGEENQTTSGWTTAGYDAADEPAVVEVETGSGTGVYERWVNCGDVSLSTVIGVGSLGKYFSYNNSTGVITFGDGGHPEDLAYDAAESETYIDVADASDFSASDIIHIVDDNGLMQNSIASISAAGGAGGSDRINLDTALSRAFTTANNSFVRVHVGGDIPVSGAKIRVYNIGIGSKNSGGTRVIAADPNNDLETDFSYGGKCTLSKTYLFGCHLSLYGPEIVTINNIGSMDEIYLRQVFGAIINYVTVCISRYDTRSTPYRIYGFNAIFNSEFNNCVIAGKIGYTVYFSNSYDNGFNNCDFRLINRTSSNNRALRLYLSSNFIFNYCKFIGMVYADNSSNIILNNTLHSDSPNSSDPGNTSYSFSFSGGNGNIIDDLQLIPEGISTSYINGDISASGLLIKNVNYPSITRWFITMNSNTEFLNSYIYGSPSTYIVYTGGQYTNVRIQNVTSDGFIFPLSLTLASNLVIKGMDHDSVDVRTATGWYLDTHFYELRIAQTVGVMGILFNPKSDSGVGYSQSSPSALKWNLNGSMYILEAGGYIEYLWPHWVRGITEFPSGGSVNIAGSGTGNFTLQYQIDTGAGWNGSWLTLNHTNLSSHSIDPDLGFRFKMRITHASGSSSDYLNRLNLTTTVNYESYPYPEELVDVILQNVQDGSRYWIYNQSTSKIIANGIQSGYGDITIENVPYTGSPSTLLIRVRKGGGGSDDYKPFETNATLTANGATVWVSQVLDDLTT